MEISKFDLAARSTSSSSQTSGHHSEPRDCACSPCYCIYCGGDFAEKGGGKLLLFLRLFVCLCALQIFLVFIKLISVGK